MKMMNPNVSAGRNETVILVHGLARTQASMKPVARFLTQQGYRVLNFSYPSTKHSITELSDQYLTPFIAANCAAETRHLHFVTHSMGGIVVRYYLKYNRVEPSGRVVMLAPPNQGSEVTDWLKDSWLYRWLLGPAGQELGTDPQSLPSVLGAVEFELGIIAGDRSVNPLNSLKIGGSDDGKIAVKHTKVAGMCDFLLVHRPHPFIMRDPLVLQQIVHFLQTGQFRRSNNAEGISECPPDSGGRPATMVF